MDVVVTEGVEAEDVVVVAVEREVIEETADMIVLPEKIALPVKIVAPVKIVLPVKTVDPAKIVLPVKIVAPEKTGRQDQRVRDLHPGGEEVNVAAVVEGTEMAPVVDLVVELLVVEGVPTRSSIWTRRPSLPWDRSHGSNLKPLLSRLGENEKSRRPG